MSSSSSPRRMSFTSASMAFGAWPEDIDMVDPIINIVILLEELPEMKEIGGMVDVVLKFERMSGVPVGTAGKKDWKIQALPTPIDSTKLIRTLKCNKTSTKEVVDLISVHMQDDLRNRKGLPWWEFLLIENSNHSNGISAVVFRVEHCLADGMSLAKLFEAFLTKENGEPVNLIPKSLQDKKEQKKKQQSSKLKLYAKIIPALGHVLSLAKSKFDHATVFGKSTHGTMAYNNKRSVVLFPTTPLDFIKDIKNAHESVTVNDVLFTALSLAITGYNNYHQCPIQGKKKDKLRCRALLPVALPRSQDGFADHSQALRNKWVFVSADMGSGIQDEIERLMFINKKMKHMKTSPVPFVQHSVQEQIPPKVGIKLARQTLYDTFSCHSLVFSNVPGPQYPCLFGGKKGVGCYMLFNNLIPQIGILSYNNQVFMCMTIDHTSYPECDKLASFYQKALIKLAKASNVQVPQEFQSPTTNE